VQRATGPSMPSASGGVRTNSRQTLRAPQSRRLATQDRRIAAGRTSSRCTRAARPDGSRRCRSQAESVDFGVGSTAQIGSTPPTYRCSSMNDTVIRLPGTRSRSAAAKNADALRRISWVRRNSRCSRSRSFNRRRSSVAARHPDQAHRAREPQVRMTVSSRSGPRSSRPLGSPAEPGRFNRAQRSQNRSPARSCERISRGSRILPADRNTDVATRAGEKTP
jgi:hypothetical protein